MVGMAKPSALQALSLLATRASATRIQVIPIAVNPLAAGFPLDLAMLVGVAAILAKSVQESVIGLEAAASPLPTKMVVVVAVPEPTKAVVTPTLSNWLLVATLGQP